jgi:DNA adenine methylase
MQKQQSARPASIIPFLKWPGGKRWLVSQHSDWFHSRDGRHIEPFLGGAAAFFHSLPASAILTDANSELIATYEAVRADPHGVLKHLRHHQRRHSDSYYYSMRDRVPRSPVTRAARFIYLNRTCFNGIYRVNLKGVFNVPIGTKSSVILPTDDFEAIATLLKGVKLATRDFAQTIKLVKERDVLYIDPPYTVKHNNNNFVKYNERIFSWADQIRLSKCALHAAEGGARVLISNADHPYVRELYRQSIWQQITVHRFSKLASFSKNRRPTTELVISNYLSATGEIAAVRT